MSYAVIEALLEAYYTRALADLLAEVYGAKVLRFLKPSTNKEVFVGFDQGWIKTSLTEDELEKQLKKAVTTGENSEQIYVAFFLQFKVADLLSIRSKYCPSAIVPPYHRAELSLYPSDTTGISQHETLRRLQLALGSKADVSYACGLLSDADDVYIAHLSQKARPRRAAPSRRTRRSSSTQWPIA